MHKIVLASGNRHKYEEIAGFFTEYPIFADNRIQLISSDMLPEIPENIEETGQSYEANALIKARAWADFTGMPSLADDSGLEVRRLSWRPGIHSARVVDGSDQDRVLWLLEQMKGVSDRRACFVACLVLAFPADAVCNDEHVRNYFAVEGRCWGHIADTYAGTGGFGYDPVFVPDGYDQTFGSLGAEVKSKISHRSIAMRGLAQIIPSVLKYFFMNNCRSC